ncbi:hypothetical protein Tco_1503099 [Tanacetum coccineum]
MTRSSKNKLYTPYKDPECEFRSSRRHLKTLRQFLKELRENTFSGSYNEDAPKRGRSTKTSDGLAAIQAQLNNLGEELRKEEGKCGPKFLEDCGAYYQQRHYPESDRPGSFTLPCFINDFCFDNALVDLGASVSVMPLSTYLNLILGELVHTRLTVELADRIVKYPKGITENVLVGIDKFTFPVDFIILDMPEDIRVPLILGRPFLSTTHAKIDVYKRKFTLRVGEENIIFKSVKPVSSIIKSVYMLSLRERMELDVEARLMEKLWRLIDH